MAWVTAVIGLASAVWSGIEKNKASQERKRLGGERPDLENSEFVEEQMNMARADLSAGGNTASRVAREEALGQDFATSLDAILRGGGNVNNMADLYDNSEAGRLRLAMMEDDLRMKRVQNLVAAGQQSEQFRQQQFQFNQWAPWADDAQATARAYQSANDQMWAGFANAGSSIAYDQWNRQQQKKLGLTNKTEDFNTI